MNLITIIRSYLPTSLAFLVFLYETKEFSGYTVGTFALRKERVAKHLELILNRQNDSNLVQNKLDSLMYAKKFLAEFDIAHAKFTHGDSLHIAMHKWKFSTVAAHYALVEHFIALGEADPISIGSNVSQFARHVTDKKLHFYPTKDYVLFLKQEIVAAKEVALDDVTV